MFQRTPDTSSIPEERLADYFLYKTTNPKIKNLLKEPERTLSRVLSC
jgi:hypothetical protein